MDILQNSCGQKCIWMLMDDHSDYKTLFSIAYITVGDSAVPMGRTPAVPGKRNCVISDAPTHFMNYISWQMCLRLMVHNHFWLPYCLWSSSAVTGVRKDFGRTVCTKVPEAPMIYEQSSDLGQIVQSALNNHILLHRRSIALLSSFTGSSWQLTYLRFIKALRTTLSSVNHSVLEQCVNTVWLQDFVLPLYPIVQKSVPENCYLQSCQSGHCK